MASWLKPKSLSQEEQDAIWKFFQQEDEHIQSVGFPSRARVRFLAKKISRGERVLNIGVGAGYFEQILSQREVEVYALDPIEEAVKQVQSYCVEARQGYAHDIPFNDDFFDFVVMSEVLEHIPDEYLLESLKEIHRVLRRGGAFIGTVPADEVLSQNLVVCPYCGQVFHRWGHQRSFSQEKLETLLSRFFSNVSIKRFFFADWQRLNWKGKVIALLKIWQARLNVQGSNQNFYFEARKK